MKKKVMKFLLARCRIAMVKLADHASEEVQASECLVWCSIEAASVVDEDWTHQDLRVHHPYLVR